MTRRVVVILLGVVALGLAGWLWATSEPAPHAAIDDDDDAAVGVRYEYNLMTHCGVDFIRFDGRWWEAQPHLDDGNGNPPEPWANGLQDGTLRLESERELVFDAGGDLQLRFEEPAVIAETGDDPAKSSDVARLLERAQQRTSPTRDNLIKKGLLYAPQRGEIAFTVPHFAAQPYLSTGAPPVASRAGRADI